MFAQKLELSSTDDIVCYGCSVSITTTLAGVGVLVHAAGLGESGNVVIYSRVGTGWTQVFMLSPPLEASDSLFGSGLAVRSSKILVQNDRGVTYMFTRQGVAWQLKNSTLSEVSESSSTETHMILKTSPESIYDGRIIIYANPIMFVTTTWVRFTQLSAVDGMRDDMFGKVAAVGAGYIVVGAPYKVVNGTAGAGAAYVYRMIGTESALFQKLLPPVSKFHALFGDSVSIFNKTIVVGSPYDEASDGVRSGAVYCFTLSNNVWSMQTRISADGGDDGWRFGQSVSVHGSVLAIGAPDANVGFQNLGIVFVYTRSGEQWVSVQTIQPPYQSDLHKFGEKLILRNESLLICDASSERMDEYIMPNPLYTFSRTILVRGDESCDHGKSDQYRVTLDPLAYGQQGSIYVELNPAQISPSRKFTSPRKK
eukprot:TRINITY_DN2185_c0_g1_i7.p1 TRINITY_DN2185_c0_g1~~TRINITY_DN2185_c0_g1_i7.p1  ORF type:complete len:424 (+),score=53.52 TRINITY_DN2185_c0_g1_i7:491-1762(+)